MSTVSRVMDMFDNLDIPKNEVDELLRELQNTIEHRLLQDEGVTSSEPTNLFKTVYRVEVLSESEPVTTDDLTELGYLITEGDCSGLVSVVASEEISRERMKEELIAQGSDPGFLLSDEDEEED